VDFLIVLAEFLHDRRGLFHHVMQPIHGIRQIHRFLPPAPRQPLGVFRQALEVRRTGGEGLHGPLYLPDRFAEPPDAPRLRLQACGELVEGSGNFPRDGAGHGHVLLQIGAEGVQFPEVGGDPRHHVFRAFFSRMISTISQFVATRMGMP